MERTMGGGVVRSKISAWCLAGCVVVLGACAATVEPEGEAELVDPTPQGSVHLFGEAEKMIAQNDREGAERACALSRDASKREALNEVEAADAFARTAFCFAEIERLEWENLRLDSSDMEEVKSQLDAKIQAMEKLRSTYQEVIDMGSIEWTLAAGTRTGDIFVHFADAITNSPTPTILDDEASALYREQLEDVATPLYAEAGARYARVVKMAEEKNAEGAYVTHAKQMSERYK